MSVCVSHTVRARTRTCCAGCVCASGLHPLPPSGAHVHVLLALLTCMRIPPITLSHHAFVRPQENPDLFKWLTGQLVPPEEVASNPAYSVLRLHVQQTLGQNSQEATKAAPGAEWVRGWDDAWKGKGAGAAAGAGDKEAAPSAAVGAKS